MEIADLTKAHEASMPWLKDSVILATRAGSHAYGTNIEGSDEDYRGVAVAPREYYLGFVKTFEQAEQHAPYDSVIYELRKFMRLAADCNPSILELLFVDQSDVIYETPAGWLLRLNAQAFLSKKAQYTFTGYAISQLGRIKRHYAWLKNPPKAAPKRSDYGLPESTLVPADQRMAAEAAIHKKIQTWMPDLEPLDPATRILVTDRMQKALVDMKLATDTDVWRAAARDIGVSDSFLHLLGMERAYNGAKNEWASYQNWKATRNPARAALEEKYGYDTKHGMHLVRLMRMGYEIMTEGKVIVKRPDAKELLEIRAGAWSYEQLLEFAGNMEKRIVLAAGLSSLPRAPDREALDKLCVSLADQMHNNSA
jgi:predicted nucleotidyltransferase